MGDNRGGGDGKDDPFGFHLPISIAPRMRRVRGGARPSAVTERCDQHPPRHRCGCALGTKVRLAASAAEPTASANGPGLVALSWWRNTRSASASARHSNVAEAFTRPEVRAR